ncbi:MAG: DUF3108 domain-containing protein [Pseudomonadota bacterium]
MRVLICFLLLGIAPAFADQKDYVVTVSGFNAGVLSVSDSSDTRNYRVAARVVSRGLAAFFGRTVYEGSADGRIRNGRLLPSRYSGQITSGDRFSRVALAYRNNTPRIVDYTPSPPAEVFVINPATQRGTVDILTSAYWVFRERPAAELCDLSYNGFDGIRRTQVTLGPPLKKGEKIVCEGVYSRVAGFSERALRRGSDFPLTLTYIPGPKGYILEEISAKTVFGSARVRLTQ